MHVYLLRRLQDTVEVAESQLLQVRFGPSSRQQLSEQVGVHGHVLRLPNVAGNTTVPSTGVPSYLPNGMNTTIRPTYTGLMNTTIRPTYRGLMNTTIRPTYTGLMNASIRPTYTGLMSTTIRPTYRLDEHHYMMMNTTMHQHT